MYGEPYWFKISLFGFEVYVDQCLCARLIIGAIILTAVLGVFYALTLSTGPSKKS